MPRHPTPLKFLSVGWFSAVMGLFGLALAWFRAAPLMGPGASGAALIIGGLAGLVLLALLVASALRARRHPQAWQEDLRHPVRHTFVAALPAALILAAATGVALAGPSSLLAGLWGLASLLELWVTVWVLSRWWQPVGAAPWAGITPVLFIPVVGNVLVPLAGAPLGYHAWSIAQFGIGVFFWPVVVTLIAVRLLQQGLWPERLLASAFIFVAPPAAIGQSALQLGAPLFVGWLCWGIALFSLLWVAPLVRRITAQPFGLPHWGVSFPLAAFASLTLRLAEPGTPMALLGVLLLAVASLVIAALLLGTLRGWRDGSLLAPEPVASLQVAGAAGAGSPHASATN